MSRAQQTSAVEQNGGGVIAPFLAGKNKIINGDFRINQRNFTSTSTNGYTIFDRFQAANTNGTVTWSAQTFTPGAAPVSGYEGLNYIQVATSGQSTSNSYSGILQRMEDVRLFAGQTVTVSFWAKSASGTPNVGISFEQYTGVGGSPAITTTTAPNVVAISTSWARYSITTTLPSLAGQTIGTGSYFTLWLFTSCGSSVGGYATGVGVQNNTISFWGIQAENGSVATPFTTASNTFQGELALCQRYYYQLGGVANGFPIVGGYLNATGNQIRFPISFPTNMRIAPSITVVGTWNTSGNTTQPNPVFINQQGFSIEISSSSGQVPAAYAYPDTSGKYMTINAEL